MTKGILKFRLIFLFIFILPSAGLGSSNWEAHLDNDGNVEFHAIGRPSVIKINGKGGAPKGWIKLNKGKITSAITFDLNSLDTEIPQRNEHMKNKYLETKKYPQAKLALTSVNLPNPPPEGDFAEIPVSFQGDLTLHGVTKPIEGEAKVEVDSGTLKVTANFETKISTYNIPVPSFSGITVADKVQVEVTFSAPLQVKK